MKAHIDSLSNLDRVLLLDLPDSSPTMHFRINSKIGANSESISVSVLNSCACPEGFVNLCLFDESSGSILSGKVYSIALSNKQSNFASSGGSESSSCVAAVDVDGKEG